MTFLLILQNIIYDFPMYYSALYHWESKDQPFWVLLVMLAWALPMALIGIVQIFKRKGLFNWDQSYPFPSYNLVGFIGHVSQIFFIYFYFMDVYITHLNALAGACCAIRFITGSFYLVEVLRIPALMVFHVFNHVRPMMIIVYA